MLHVLLPPKCACLASEHAVETGWASQQIRSSWNERLLINWCHFKLSRNFLLPAPVGLRIAATESQLLDLGSIRQHGPDLFRSRTARLKHDMAPVRRPAREVVAPAIVSQLDPLFTRDIHQINIVRTGRSRSVFAKPCECQELSIRRP